MSNQLVRFIRKSREYSFPEDRKKIRIKGNAFFPMKKDGRYETSCLEKRDLLDEQMEDVGKSLLSNPQELKGFVRFDQETLSGIELSFEIDGIGHDYHGNILDWPALEGSIKLKCEELAEKINELDTTYSDIKKK